jgi:hypothetical protein
MSIFESNNADIILEIEEEPVDVVEVKEYKFPLWGLIVVTGIWIFVAILIVAGIIMVVLDKKRRMN